MTKYREYAKLALEDKEQNDALRLFRDLESLANVKELMQIVAGY